MSMRPGRIGSAMIPLRVHADRRAVTAVLRWQRDLGSERNRSQHWRGCISGVVRATRANLQLSSAILAQSGSTGCGRLRWSAASSVGPPTGGAVGRSLRTRILCCRSCRLGLGGLMGAGRTATGGLCCAQLSGLSRLSGAGVVVVELCTQLCTRRVQSWVRRKTISRPRWAAYTAWDWRYVLIEASAGQIVSSLLGRQPAGLPLWPLTCGFTVKPTDRVENEAVIRPWPDSLMPALLQGC